LDGVTTAPSRMPGLQGRRIHVRKQASKYRSFPEQAISRRTSVDANPYRTSVDVLLKPTGIICAESAVDGRSKPVDVGKRRRSFGATRQPPSSGSGSRSPPQNPRQASPATPPPTAATPPFPGPPPSFMAGPTGARNSFGGQTTSQVSDLLQRRQLVKHQEAALAADEPNMIAAEEALRQLTPQQRVNATFFTGHQMKHD